MEEKIEKGIDFATDELRQNISKVITASNLPPVIVKYILKDFLMDFEMIEQTVIKQQHQDYEQKLKKDKK